MESFPGSNYDEITRFTAVIHYIKGSLITTVDYLATVIDYSTVCRLFSSQACRGSSPSLRSHLASCAQRTYKNHVSYSLFTFVCCCDRLFIVHFFSSMTCFLVSSSRNAGSSFKVNTNQVKSREPVRHDQRSHKTRFPLLASQTGGFSECCCFQLR